MIVSALGVHILCAAGATTWVSLCLFDLQEGNADAGRYQLETALDVMYKQTGGHNMEAVAADYHFKLGRCVVQSHIQSTAHWGAIP